MESVKKTKTNEKSDQGKDFWSTLEKDINKFRDDIAAVDYEGIGNQIKAELKVIGTKAAEKVKEIHTSLRNTTISETVSEDSNIPKHEKNTAFLIVDSDDDIREDEEIEVWDADDEIEEVEEWEYHGWTLVEEK